MAKWLKATRIASQILFLVLFVYLFRASASVARPLFTNPFFQSDPLLFIATSLANRSLLPFLLPLLFMLATAVLGRVFCGFVCPLGSLIDGFDAVVGRIKYRKLDFRFLKYYLLFFLLVLALLGSTLVFFFDPIVITGRSFVGVIRPVVSLLTGSPVMHNGIIFFAIMAGILMFGFIQKRFWCRNLCPLGALLGLVGRFSLLRYRLDDDCKECSLCARLCPTQAIDSDERVITSSECIRCMNCLGDCPEKKIHIGFGVGPLPGPGPDLSRRGFLASVGLGIIAAPLLKTDFLTKINLGKVIRPPGAIPESLFLNACVRCGECVKVCPTRGLQPVMFQGGLAGLFAPRLEARIGGCERNCNGCGQVCPTGAIRKLSLDEKSYVKMGTAVIHKEMCLAWEQDKVCLICDEACPYNAITSRLAEAAGSRLLRPFIDEELCTGCGICESRCPIAGPSAIEILPIGEERLSKGSYMTARKRELREQLERGTNEDIPSGFIE